MNVPAVIELAAPGIWQELQLQILDCPHCKFRGAAVYLESRAGGLDTEIVKHFAYSLRADDIDAIVREISGCPNQSSRHCGCHVHQSIVAKYRLGESTMFVGLQCDGDPMWLNVG